MCQVLVSCVCGNRLVMGGEDDVKRCGRCRRLVTATDRSPQMIQRSTALRPDGERRGCRRHERHAPLEDAGIGCAAGLLADPYAGLVRDDV